MGLGDEVRILLGLVPFLTRPWTPRKGSLESCCSYSDRRVKGLQMYGFVV